MNKTLTLQYQLIVSARYALFAYCRNLQRGDFQKPVSEFNDNSIKYMLVHIANTYIHWLAKIGLQQSYPYFEDDKYADMEAVEMIYVLVDKIVNEFLTEFAPDLETTLAFNMDVLSVLNEPVKNIQLNLSPLQLFTYAITHEFHHKGQILSMSRLLGYTPTDTDVIRY